MTSATGRLHDAATGALLGTFVGDALGMPYERRRGDAIPERIEMRDGRAPAGSYTDDTQMMIGLTESLLRRGRIEPADLARTFSAHYEPARGYGSGTRAVMSLWDEGVRVEDAAGRIRDGRGSQGNGAAMRVAPVGVRFWRDEARVMGEARRSALVTHAHPEGAAGAVVQAVAVAAAIAGDDPVDAARAAAGPCPLGDRLDGLMAATGGGLDPSRLGGPDRCVPSSATASVAVAVLVGGRADSFEQAVTVAVRCGGDTDTVAAMAGAIAGARFGAGSIPSRWHAVLENGERGRDHVHRLAGELATAAAAS